jgi:hypothetical protein
MVSDCCGIGPENDEGICPKCKEHCGWVDEGEGDMNNTLTLRAFRSALVRHDVIPPESIEDAEGFDGGRMMQATRLAFEELTGDATDNKETT